MTADAAQQAIRPGADELARLLPMLRAFALRALGPNDAVEDLVQEALLAASERLHDYRGEARLSTWVVGILSHKIVDHFRRTSRWRMEELEETDPPGLLAPPRPRTPERELAQREAMRLIEAALPGLPALERMAVLLVDVEAVDHEEACRVLGVTATHLRVLLHRGRHRLRKVLDDADV